MSHKRVSYRRVSCRRATHVKVTYRRVSHRRASYRRIHHERVSYRRAALCLIKHITIPMSYMRSQPHLIASLTRVAQ